MTTLKLIRRSARRVQASQKSLRPFAAAVFALVVSSVIHAQTARDPLPSWNEGPAKSAIIDFVGRVTHEGGPDFVAPEQRIATFDNDGTLWCEQPMYVQAAFSVDRVKALAPAHPEWRDKQPFKALLAGDRKGVADAGEAGLIAIVTATHSGMTVDQFERIVADWLATARHPRFDRPYTSLAYQPMIEVLAYLRAHGFKTFIVSGGGIDFMRPWTERVYGVPPEQVVGSSGKIKYELVDKQPALMKLPEVNFIDDGPGKPVGIQQFIGRRPIIAFGNSDGDFEMLQWTTSGNGPKRPRLGLIVHHTDAEREYAYDRDSQVGRLARGLDAAPSEGWIVIDMKNDWKVVFPEAQQ